jgi:hypothetical protein
MKKLILASLLVASLAFAGDVKRYKVHYQVDGSGHDIIVQAESSSDARYTVEAMIEQALVTGVREIR